MLLEALRNFEWLNEPNEFAFSERGLKITALPKTDFWQDKTEDYNKINGHFFFCSKQGAFSMTTHWRCGIPLNFAQCGLMGRIDDKNWFKISLFSKNGTNMNVGTVVTNDGDSDMALAPIIGSEQEVWFRLKRTEKHRYELSYSLNGLNFISVRSFNLKLNKESIESGVFICSPSGNPYTAVLISIDFS